jgi:hypothetical protein
MMVQVTAYTMLDRLEVSVAVLDFQSPEGDLGWQHWRKCSIPMPDDADLELLPTFVALVAETVLDLAYGR